MKPLSSIFILLAFALCAAAQDRITVAADGAGDVKTVQAAIDRVPENNKRRVVIRIKPGRYHEQIRVPANKPYISFIGEKAETTVLTFNLSNKDAGSTSASYSTYIGGHDFYAENITFENSFGTGSQAVALLVEADRAVFKKCRFLAWQDTLYAKGGRQFYQDCHIEGHVDFIFGQAAALFENCRIHSKGEGYIAAPMRFSDTEPTGFVFRKCRLTGANTGKGVFLARPWRAYGRTVFLETEMGAHIRPEGWDNWRDSEREKTAYFAEYKSTGPGANPAKRVTWARALTDAEAKNFAENFITGKDGWQPLKADFAWQSSHPPEFKLVSWGDTLKQAPLWYAVDEATRIANQVLFYQHDNGGWSKNIDMAAMLTQAERRTIAANKASAETTIDNGATYTQLRYLAKVITAKDIAAHKEGFFKGLDFLLSMQYANGGFPQFFPLQSNYSRHITYNDGAMIGALKLLRDIAKKKPDFAFVDEPRRARAEAAVAKGIECILRTQITVNGAKTVWCAQHDEVTFAPANARKYELVSFSGGESVDIVKFLMDSGKPTPEIAAAVEGAVEWFRQTQLKGIRWVNHRVVKDPNAPPLWARFYHIETNRPIFVGRDGVIRYDVAEIEAERRNGYRWYADDANELLNKDYPKWKERFTQQARNDEQ
jgi:PelA/Pel-15E family pectate lyase